MTMITKEQYDFLIKGIDKRRVGYTHQGMAHVEAWDGRRHLIRIFGFDGFDIETLSIDLVREIEHQPGEITYSSGEVNKRTVWTVIYRAQVRLIIKVDGKEICHFDDGAIGDGCNQSSLGLAHDMGLKIALSQALKRCCVNLGDQFGLSLYNGGSMNPSVHQSLVTPYGSPVIPPPDTCQVQPEPTSQVQPEPTSQQPAEEASTTPETQVPPVIDVDGQDEPTHTLEPAYDRISALRVRITGAATEQVLRDLYREIADALHAGDITRSAADALANAIRERKDELLQQQKAPQIDERKAQRHMHVLFSRVGLGGAANRDRRIDVTSRIIGRTISTSSELTEEEIRIVIRDLTESDPLSSVA